MEISLSGAAAVIGSLERDAADAAAAARSEHGRAHQCFDAGAARGLRQNAIDV